MTTVIYIHAVSTNRLIRWSLSKGIHKYPQALLCCQSLFKRCWKQQKFFMKALQVGMEPDSRPQHYFSKLHGGYINTYESATSEEGTIHLSWCSSDLCWQMCFTMKLYVKATQKFWKQSYLTVLFNCNFN